MKKVHINYIFIGIITLLSFNLSAAGQDRIVKSSVKIRLGETLVKVNVYEKRGARLTFIAPHFDEQTGTRLVKDSIAARGGRLVEIESVDAAGEPSRYINFSLNGKSYRIDPNRIFTGGGRRCAGFSGEPSAALKNFAEEFLSIFLAPDAKLRDGERFLAAVHNNTDIGGKSEAAKKGDLTAYAFVRYEKTAHPSRGAFQKQAEGVYLSNLEEDEDNFIFLSTTAFISYFAEKGFNVVVQKPASKLQSADCAIDDGSLSVFAGQQNLPYVNIEADARSGAARQRQMIDSVYQLLNQTEKPDEKTFKTVAEITPVNP